MSEHIRGLALALTIVVMAIMGSRQDDAILALQARVEALEATQAQQVKLNGKQVEAMGLLVERTRRQP